MLLELLDLHGFKGHYDFVYLPIDFKRRVVLGYGIVNMVTHEDALEIKCRLHGFGHWKVASENICEVAWAGSMQGLEGLIARYKNSPVMHPDVPEEGKPLLFEG